MKAVGFNKFGSTDVLETLEIPIPALKADSVLIRVVAAGVNPADWRLRDGQFKRFIKTPFPFILGSDVAGVVEKVGVAVTRFRPGDSVYTMLPSAAGGAYAQFVLATESIVACIPSGLSFEQAAAVPLAALTALQALRDKAHLQSCASVMIYGASGGVGTFAVQIAKVMGAHVTAVCSGRNVDLVRSLGADAILDYTRQDVTSGTNRYDIVFDAVNHFPFWKGLRLLRSNGVLVSVNPVMEVIPTYKWLSQLRGKRLAAVFVEPKAADLEAITNWIELGKLRPIIEQVYPMSQVADAHQLSATGRARGKLVLIMDQSETSEFHAD